MNRSIQRGYVHINFAAKFDANFIYRPADIHFAQTESLYIIGFCLTNALRLAFLYAYVSFITGKSLLIKKALCIIMHYSFKHEAMPSLHRHKEFFYACCHRAVPFFGMNMRLISACSSFSSPIFLSRPPAYPVRLPFVPTTR